MSYVMDRRQVFHESEIVAVLSVRQRGVRSQVLLRDGSLYRTLTRPGTFRRNAQESHGKTVRQI